MVLATQSLVVGGLGAQLQGGIIVIVLMTNIKI